MTITFRPGWSNLIPNGQIWWASNFSGSSAALLSALQGCSHLLLPLLGPTTLALANLKLGTWNSPELQQNVTTC